MRILFCSNEQLLPLTGGGTVGNLQIVKKMVQKCYDVTVSTPFYINKSEVEKELKIKMVPFSPFYMHKNISVRGPKYLIYSFLFFFHFLKLILKSRYDIIFVRNALIGFPIGVVGWFLRLFGKKTVYVISYTDFLVGFLMENNKYPKFILKMFLFFEQNTARLFDKIFVITPQMKNKLTKRGINPKKILLSYDGVDTSIFDPQKISDNALKNAKAIINTNKNVVIFHGTIDSHGVNMARKIINITLKKRLDINFVFVGAGKRYEELKESMKQKNVHFTGYIEHKNLPALIYLADVGIIPYEKNYNLDMVITLKLLEYLAMGTRVVATKLCSINDIFGSYDFIKLASSPEEFSEMIINSLNKPKSKQAIEIIQKKFSWDTITEEIIKKMV